MCAKWHMLLQFRPKGKIGPKRRQHESRADADQKVFIEIIGLLAGTGRHNQEHWNTRTKRRQTDQEQKERD